MNDSNLGQKRDELAERFGYKPCPALPSEKVGIARNVRSGLLPINGVRSLPENGTSGWYIWAGETMLSNADFFVPLHVSHLPDWCPDVLPYLELPPGWRFLIAPGHEDVWFDTDVDLSPVDSVK